MSRMIAATAGMLIGLMSSAATAGVPGRIDPGFGMGGRVFTDNQGTEIGFAVFVDPDGLLVVTPERLYRYHADGALDRTFATGGFATLPTRAVAALRLGDGKIVTGGGIGVARIDANGAPDPTFGNGGAIAVGLVVWGIGAQPNGAVLAAGQKGFSSDGSFAVVRITSDGGLDPSFGTNGMVTTAVGGVSEARAVVVQPDGKIVAGGWTAASDVARKRLMLVRYDADGTLDASFGDAGIALADVPAAIESLALQPDGAIVAATDVGAVYVVRWTSAGVLDATFGSGGIATTRVGNSGDVSNLLRQPDGKLVVAAARDVVRLLPDGTPDPSFGVAGVTTVDLTGVTAISENFSGGGLALEPDGRIVFARGAYVTDSRAVVTPYVAVARLFGGTCGDGVVDGGEECDDGNVGGGDGCDAHCCVADADGDGLCDADDPCATPLPVSGAKVAASKLSTMFADDRLDAKVDVAVTTPVDPVTHGVRFAIDDTQTNRLDVIIPGGAFDRATGRGWKHAFSNWKWVDRAPALPGRVNRVSIQDRSATSGIVRVTVSATGRSFATLAAAPPLSATFVLDPPGNGRCGVATFPGPAPAPSCVLRSLGDAIVCR